MKELKLVPYTNHTFAFNYVKIKNWKRKYIGKKVLVDYSNINDGHYYGENPKFIETILNDKQITTKHGISLSMVEGTKLYLLSEIERRILEI